MFFEVVFSSPNNAPNSSASASFEAFCCSETKELKALSFEQPSSDSKTLVVYIDNIFKISK